MIWTISFRLRAHFDQNGQAKLTCQLGWWDANGAAQVLRFAVAARWKRCVRRFFTHSDRKSVGQDNGHFENPNTTRSRELDAQRASTGSGGHLSARIFAQMRT